MRNIDARRTESVSVDVLVVGGGAAGVACAVTARQYGLRVLLAERYGFCGGGAVAGLSGTICGMYEASESQAPPRQVVFGFLDRFVAAMKQRGGLGPALKYGKTFTHVHDPLVWREVADALLAEAGVQVILHATAMRALTQGGERIEGALLWTKQGPLDVRAAVTVDASGDADICAMAGFPTFVGDQDGKVQNPTMIFRLQGVDVPRFLKRHGADTIMGPDVTQAIQVANDSGKYALPRSKVWVFPTTRRGELLCNCTRVIGADGRELNPLRFSDFTDAEIEGRKQVREYARFMRDHLEGCEDSFVNDTGVQVGVRQTRQVEGVSKLRNADVVAGSKFADGIARSPWPIELHAGSKPRVEWLLNDYYEIPYGCFVPARGEGLLVAGRCLSAEHEAVASARVTAQCFSYGHAVGHAAAICARQGIEPRRLQGTDLRDVLNRDGAQLH